MLLVNPRSTAIVASIPLLLMLACSTATSQEGAVDANAPFETGLFRWQVSPPLLGVETAQLPPSPEHPWIAVKDPSIVRYEGNWHLFCTLRKQRSGDGRIRIGYLHFRDWSTLNQSSWSVLTLTDGYHGAPQIFYFRPQKKWYLIYQAADDSRDLKYGPCFSTNDKLDEPQGWTLPQPLYVVPDGQRAGLDYWVICDDVKAHLFFTTLNGLMWRCETALTDFPNAGWSSPKVALRADIFEASHTYKLVGREQYVTFVEAQAKQRRYFKAYIADRLDGEWQPLADSLARPFVSPSNVLNQDKSWASSYSHGEFIRAGYDQKLAVNPLQIQLLFQGASDEEYQQGGYGDISWRLGLLHLQATKP